MMVKTLTIFRGRKLQLIPYQWYTRTFQRVFQRMLFAWFYDVYPRICKHPNHVALKLPVTSGPSEGSKRWVWAPALRIHHRLASSHRTFLATHRRPGKRGVVAEQTGKRTEHLGAWGLAKKQEGKKISFMRHHETTFWWILIVVTM